MSEHGPVVETHRTHRVRRMAGRDPHEVGRTTTTLELLYDLVFVVAIGQAANQFAHLLAEGHFGAAIGAFAFAMYAVLWAWISFSWFSSAFDTDDWIHRLATMVQMVGATIMALGLPPVFHSIDEGHSLDNRLVVAGYVVMRIAMVFMWLRAASQSPKHRATCMTYVWTIVIAQVGWIATALLPMTLTQTLLAGGLLLAIELLGPYLAETRHGSTPWHAHHIAERYGLLAIIALGEGVVGTVASLSAVVESHGWTLDAVLVACAGMGLTFGMWWAYFLIAAGDVLHARRERAYKWAYSGMPIFAAIAATGAGLHVAALVLEGKAHIGPVAAVLALAVPVAVYLLGIYWLYSVLYDEYHWFHGLLLVVTAAVLAAGPTAAYLGLSVPMCLLIVMAAPAVTVVGYEVFGYRHVGDALRRATGA
ncbi:low temperature requirement protein LtrA [Paucibacter oligotrophus]|uniref:Low temperature requirement protein LtrA n=1 Tax=Roseateles oligotrophus TaxID=1769250 RepID=A0A840LG61_9BURK|nr:low temperature requirement protein A [Roseateles oligotrophus]MBB4845612.1 low temperature requirement protein LtrA [Roseateles oligotrophus]